MDNHFESRSYKHPDDLTSVIDLIRVRPPKKVDDYPSMVDLQELLYCAEIQANSQLWFTDNGELAGYAFNDHYPEFSGISFEIDPKYLELGSEIMAWCMENFRNNRQEKATQLQLSVATDDIRRIELLEAHGFLLENWSLVVMTRQLSDPFPDPSLPDGFSIRPFKGEEEISDWVALHRAAFGTQGLTIEHRRSWMLNSGYSPSLDLLAVAPDGSLAAYVYYAVHPEENDLSGVNVGTIDSAGTLPKYLGLGLARALILAGLPVLKDLGVETASLTTASYNIAMQQAAYHASFCKTGEILYYAKKLEAWE